MLLKELGMLCEMFGNVFYESLVGKWIIPSIWQRGYLILHAQL